jgi:hypothetical protein
MPKWIQDQALPTKDECPFTGWGSSFQAECKVTLPFRLTQFAPNRKIEHPVFLSESGSDSSSSPDMILGHDLICKLGLDLKFNDDIRGAICRIKMTPLTPNEFGRLDPNQQTNHKSGISAINLAILHPLADSILKSGTSGSWSPD